MGTAQTLGRCDVRLPGERSRPGRFEEASARSHERSVHDALTGLPNRILLLERIEHAIVRSGRSRKVVAVLFIDLDDFKKVNDAHGHQVGDELLLAVAERISVALRPADTLARLSGDEFVILCEELDEVVQVETIASRIVDALAKPFSLSVADVIGCCQRRDRLRRSNQPRCRATAPRRRRGHVSDQAKWRGQLPDPRSALATPGRTPSGPPECVGQGRAARGAPYRISARRTYQRRGNRFGGSPAPMGPSHSRSHRSDDIDSTGRAVRADQRDRPMGIRARLCRIGSGGEAARGRSRWP